MGLLLDLKPLFGGVAAPERNLIVAVGAPFLKWLFGPLREKWQLGSPRVD